MNKAWIIYNTVITTQRKSTTMNRWSSKRTWKKLSSSETDWVSNYSTSFSHAYIKNPANPILCSTNPLKLSPSCSLKFFSFPLAIFLKKSQPSCLSSSITALYQALLFSSPLSKLSLGCPSHLFSSLLSKNILYLLVFFFLSKHKTHLPLTTCRKSPITDTLILNIPW